MVPQTSLDALKAAEPALDRRFQQLKAAGMSLDMTRGKPCSEQLDLSLDLITILGREEYLAVDGTDCRNYGGLDGLPEAKELFAPYLDVSPKEILIGDNSSLSLMHDTVARALSHGVVDSVRPWSAEAAPKFLCPAPGYDRHFAICEHFGLGMLNISNTAAGPDMDAVERLAGSDASVKGIWLVPKYANPLGNTLSSEVVQRLAKMPTAAPDFRIFWDNAYAAHHLGPDQDALDDILSACKAAGNPNRPVIFGSTSKVSFAGAGIGLFGGSEANVAWMRDHRSKMTIGPDKLNQRRHVKFFKDAAGIDSHMKKHAEILRPKFEAVQRVLTAELGGKGIAEWTNPKGGYFVSIDTLPGCARAVVKMAGEAGVKLTGAGATFPYGKDPQDRNIRIAPSLPSLAEIESAMEVLAVCIQRVALALHR